MLYRLWLRDTGIEHLQSSHARIPFNFGSTSIFYDKIRKEPGLAYRFGSLSDTTINTWYISSSVDGYHCDKGDIIKQQILEAINTVNENRIGKDLMEGKEKCNRIFKRKIQTFLR